MQAPPTKRKAINDFFQPSPKRSTTQSQLDASKTDDESVQLNHTPIPESTSVTGLTLHRDFVSSAEEPEILHFLNDPTRCSWRTDLSRRTMHFGGTYCLMPPKTQSGDQPSKPQVLQAPPMPVELGWLIQRMVDARVFPSDKRPQYCIINEYTGAQGISAHTENFQFEEPVVGLSLLSTCPIRFIELTRPFDGSVRSGKAGKADKTGKEVDVELPGRSLLVMNGESRWKWQHEILRSKRGRRDGWKRVSLTFRYKDEEKEMTRKIRSPRKAIVRQQLKA